ncbi:eCIS core domain-containing protein [Streptomyces exfoliatus]|uniref:eCIS core domain-containing protein n=1 Tax=Streptomyces exfoliatus TaxID=1905 RepID=UPI003F4CB28C
MHDQENARETGTGSTRRPARAPGHVPPARLSDLPGLQAMAGNAAVVQMLRQAGHSWAQEQHQHSAGCGHQRNDQAEPAVQRSAVHEVLRTPGRPMDDATRIDMESRLGADFSDVRIHDNVAARASATEVGARAYTSGSHIVLGDGGGDAHTLAHELTHVIQQRQGPVAGSDNGSGLKVSDPSDRFEREAEANATRAVALPPTAVAEHAHTQAGRTDVAPLQRAASTGTGEPVAVQRIIKVTPEMYARGIGVDLANMDRGQLNRYVTFAVTDDVKFAMRLDAGSDFATRLKRVKELITGNDVAGALEMLTPLIADVNAVQAGSTDYVQNYYPNVTNADGTVVDGAGNARDMGRDELVQKPNSETRYKTDPTGSGYAHTSLNRGITEPRWGDDTGMRSQMAAGLGPGMAANPSLYPSTPQRLARHPRGGDNLALKQLTWAQAVALLPRPLINLLFDARYQLEASAESPVVIDERTPDAQHRRDKSPGEGGTLRSWHQDDYGRLPANGFNADAIPPHAAALHAHYTTASQSGAGSAVADAADSPRGFAEYTGTGSNSEHNTKVVLDYINKRVYLTVTHYQYWALIPSATGGEPYTFWESHSQKLDQAEGALQQVDGGDQAIMMSPWLEIVM